MNITNSTVNIDNLNVYNNTSIPLKIYTKCNQIKSLTEYYKNKRKSDGLLNICKSCQSIILKHYRDKINIELHKAIVPNSSYSYKNYISITDCSTYFLILWFEFQFDEKMNWRNYGSYFQIDHVKPCSLFNIEDDNDRRLMNHWSNLSPLEKHENITKSNKYNNEIELNHTTKILRFLDHLNKQILIYVNLQQNLIVIYLNVFK